MPGIAHRIIAEFFAETVRPPTRDIQNVQNDGCFGNCQIGTAGSANRNKSLLVDDGECNDADKQDIWNVRYKC